MLINCGISIEFDAAHRLCNYKGKCERLHGHRYKVEFVFENKNILNEDCMVIDFVEIKKLLKSWIDENFDHNVILSKQDELLGKAIESTSGYKIFWLENNPTAENLAKFLNEKANSLLLQINNKDVSCVKTTIFESPNSFATFNKSCKSYNEFS